MSASLLSLPFVFVFLLDNSLRLVLVLTLSRIVWHHSLVASPRRAAE